MAASIETRSARVHRPLWILSFIFAVLPAVQGCPGGASRPDRPSVLLITIDSLRPDRLGFAGYEAGETPNLDALAGRSIRFTSAMAPAPLTTPSIASVLTGRWPLHHGVRLDEKHRLADGETTLAEALGGAGYRTAGIGGSLLLHPRHGFSQGFSQYLESFGEMPRPREAPVQGMPAARVVTRALEWLEGNYREDFFLWVNFHDPHYFYSPPAPFAQKFADRPYDGEVAYVDAELGRLLSKLKDYGIEDRTLVVVAGSHGEGLMDHGEAWHGTLLHQSTLHVPLLIKPAAAVSAGRDVDLPVSLVDLMPTLLEATGTKAPAGMDGRSIAGALREPGAVDLDPERPLLAETLLPRALFGWEPLAAVRSGRWVYVAAPSPRLYDLKDDPKEETNVIAAHPDVAARLQAEAARVTFESPACEPCGGMARELGMVWPPEGRKGPKVDPHDRIDVANDTLKAHRTFQRKLAEAASLLYRDVLARDPENRVALLESGWAMGLGKAKDDLRPALDVLARAQRLYSEDGEIYHLLGHMEQAAATPDNDRARRLWLLASKLDPLNEEALYDAACLEAVAGRREEALDLLARSITAGFKDFAHMRKDADLSSIRDDARFAQLVPAAPKRPGKPGKAGKSGEAAPGAAAEEGAAPPS
ncbi:MAG: sulfatase-like hydrolase/transferase [Candidatus Polarisedimenticolia bacterium]